MKRFSLLLVMFVFLFVLTGCPWKDDDDDIDLNENCITTNAACSAAGTFETCANLRGAWYTWKGKKYPCASLGDCTAAATQMTNDIMNFCD